MPVLDGKGLSWFTSLVKKYIGTPWSMSGDVNDTIVLINDNLDDYTTIGNYYCRPDSDAATVSNNPAGTSFILKVYSGVGRSYDTSNGNYLTQHLEDLYGNIWTRYKSTGSWSDWSKVFTVTGDSTVGSGTNPIYMNNGVLTASSSTVGSGTKPIYLNSGVITASGSTVGGTARGMYLNSGTFTALSSTVGSGTQPVYMSSGTITASTSTVGASDTPIYLKSGVFTACSSGISGISSYKFSMPGYIKYDVGLIIQWGTKETTSSDNPSSSGWYTVTFPLAFSSSSSYIIVKNRKSQSGGTRDCGRQNSFSQLTTTTAYSYCDGSDKTGEQWIAFGW